ncbi:uncharacterized protein CMC5_007750 [Chondromyces crocatus]|uniref:PEGA domain-containing protein n=2 Tax=Chondromyces crocatus TaxID=52 RepID=A0A0K1E717_CHOCO|nr:uncharacterized protein CMC5_007750 [Chondromyces crocatus]
MAQPSSSPQGAPGAPGAPSAPAPANAPPPPLSEVLSGTAKAEYEAGRILFRDGDFSNAIIKYERAYEISREPRLLWNIALCQKNLQRYTRMLATVEKLQRDAGTQLSDQDRKDAEELIATIQAFVSPMKVEVNEPGARVEVDGVEVGVTPLEKPVLVDVGSRKIRVSKKGFKDHTGSLTVSGGSEVSLSVKLVKEVHQGRLVINAGPEDVIALDGRVVGRGRWEGVVPSGGHTLRVTAPGMEAHQSEIIVQDDQVRRRDVQLKPAPKDHLATWLWIGGGAAVLAGGIIAGVLLFQPQEPAQGNVAPGNVDVSGARGFTFRFGGSQ